MRSNTRLNVRGFGLAPDVDVHVGVFWCNGIPTMNCRLCSVLVFSMVLCRDVLFTGGDADVDEFSSVHWATSGQRYLPGE